jgi:hypothetical protein
VWTPFLTPEYLRQLAGPDDLSGHVMQDPALLWPDRVLSVAAGTGGTNPAEAQDGTLFIIR